MKKIIKILLFCSIPGLVIYSGCNDYEHEKNPVVATIKLDLDTIGVIHWDTLTITLDSGTIVYSTDSLP